MYGKDVNLKFKTYMVQKRKENGLTQKEVADGIGMSRMCYLRLEAIGSNTKVTLEQTVLIFDFYDIEPAARLVAYLDNDHRQQVESRIEGVHKLLKNIIEGKFYYEDLKKAAQVLHNQYSSSVSKYPKLKLQIADKDKTL